ncbi:MAG: hypothetical protein GX442_10805, partial [Candidatus Riflebacteria bacterium]|nr:hypothetical protein [Candidatus Riflebacteria bacterium]
MADIDLSEYMGAYIDGSRENLDTMDRVLLNLEQNPNNLDAIEEIFRAAHTLKGMSATMGFEKVAHLTHEMENMLDKMRTKQMAVTPAAIDVIFETFDVLRTLVNDTITQTDSGVSLDDITGKLHAVLAGGGLATAGAPADHGGGHEAAPAEAAVPEAPAEEGAAPPADAPMPEGGGGGASPELMADLQEMALSEFEISGTVEAQQTGMIPYLLKVNLVADCLLKGPRIFMVLRTLDSSHCEIIKSLPEVKDLENEKFERTFKMIIATDHPPQEIKDGIESISEIETAHVHQLNPEAIRAGAWADAIIGGTAAGGTAAAPAAEAPPPAPEPEPAPPPAAPAAPVAPAKPVATAPVT